MKRITLLLLILSILSIGSIGAQEAIDNSNDDPGITRNMGDQTFSFTAGLFSPLFSQATDGTITSFSDHLSVGAQGALDWHFYLRKNMKIGGQLSGVFAFTPSSRVFSMVPITFVYTYIFDLYPVTIPLSLGAGFSFNRLDQLFQFTPILKPTASIYYSFNPDWSLGFNVSYWWNPEIHFDSGDLAGQTRFGNYLETSLSLMYHF